MGLSGPLMTFWGLPVRAWTPLGGGCSLFVGAAFGVSGAAFAWQVQQFDSLGSAVCAWTLLGTAGARLGAAGPRLLSYGRCSIWCFWSCFHVAVAAFGAFGAVLALGKRKHLTAACVVRLELLSCGSCSIWCFRSCADARQAQQFDSLGTAGARLDAAPGAAFAWQVHATV